MKTRPRTYFGYILSQGSYVGTSDNVLGRWYIDSPDTGYWDRRGSGFATLEEAKARVRYMVTCTCGAGPFRTMEAQVRHEMTHGNPYTGQTF